MQRAATTRRKKQERSKEDDQPGALEAVPGERLLTGPLDDPPRGHHPHERDDAPGDHEEAAAPQRAAGHVVS